MQTCPNFADATPNDGAKMDRGPLGRRVSLRDDDRTLRNRFLPAKGKRARNGLPGTVQLEARVGGGINRFLGRRSGGAILALYCSVSLPRFRQMKPYAAVGTLFAGCPINSATDRAPRKWRVLATAWSSRRRIPLGLLSFAVGLSSQGCTAHQRSDQCPTSQRRFPSESGRGSARSHAAGAPI